MIRRNEGIKRRLVREETCGVDMSAYDVEEFRRIDCQNRHRLLFFASRWGVGVGCSGRFQDLFNRFWSRDNTVGVRSSVYRIRMPVSSK